MDSPTTDSPTAAQSGAAPDAQILELARKEIDETDRELVHLLARRFDAVRRVAEAKRVEGSQPVLDPDRERAVQAHWLQDAETLGLSGSFARRVLKEILAHSRRLQEPLFDAAGSGRVHQPRVGFQGVPGAYSALAATHLLAMRSGAGGELKGYSTFPEVVEALQNRELDYALLPVENSIGGSIMEVNRLICDHELYLVDEEVWAVEHVLVGLPGARLDGVRTVRSHPAALTQCEAYLRGLEDVVRQPWFDTAGAAASVADAKDPSLAALCSEEAARLYGLEVLARDVADRERNETRFVLVALAPETTDPRLACKTSLLFRLNHHEGSLARVLTAFADAKANLTRIESRPLPDTPWEYLFFVDVEGHQAAPHLAAALRQVRASCNQLRVLGSYPSRTRKQDAHLDSAAPGVRSAAPVASAAPAQSGPAAGSVPSSGAPSLSAPSCQVPASGLAALAARSERRRSTLRVGPAAFGEGHFVLISGPCAVESLDQILDAARMVRAAGATLLRGGAFKPRTSPYAFQGLGLEGLRYLREAGRRYELPTVTEVLTIEDIPAVAAHADVLQVGARNMHNFALLKELGRLDKPIILKRGMSATVKEFLLAAEYILAGGNQQVILCERGIRTFETSTRATLDVAAVPVLRRLTHLPIIVDPSHAAGDRELVVPLALAGAAAGADGLIVEAHPRPEEALCDKEQALSAEDLRRMVEGLRPIVASQGRAW